MTPDQELTAAAKTLRGTAARIPQGTDDDHKDWAGKPWQVEECARGCACIVYQGDYPDDPFAAVKPPIQYVADAETEEHGAWIALVYPGLAEPLAAWLESEANRRHITSAHLYQGGEFRGFCSCGAAVARPNQDVPAECGRLNHALAVARVINGVTP